RTRRSGSLHHGGKLARCSRSSLALASPVQAVSNQNPTGTIAGSVVDGQSGHPLAGVTVSLRSAPRGQPPGFTTGPDGRFVFRGVPDCVCALDARAFRRKSATDAGRLTVLLHRSRGAGFSGAGFPNDRGEFTTTAMAPGDYVRT